MNKVGARARILGLFCKTQTTGTGATEYSFFDVPEGYTGPCNAIYVILGSKLAMAFLDGFEAHKNLNYNYVTRHKEIRGY